MVAPPAHAIAVTEVAHVQLETEVATDERQAVIDQTVAYYPRRNHDSERQHRDGNQAQSQTQRLGFLLEKRPCQRKGKESQQPRIGEQRESPERAQSYPRPRGRLGTFAQAQRE